MQQHDTEPPTYPMPSPYPAAGEVIDGKYQIERILGEGGMGAVAKAQHLLRRAPVALKFMSPMLTSMSGAVERFINEGVAASQIDSDHVVKIFDVGQLKTGSPYLVMEYLEGHDLSYVLARDGRPGLEIPRAVHFILQALRGLQVAHAAGIIHRDMKPSNCFVIDKDGEPDFVKLVDFGISKVQQPGGAHLTKTNSALGTPLYMSPEQARRPKDVDHRTDLYSCAVILYELLAGQTPFGSETGEFTEILFKIFTQDPPHIKTLRPDLPDELAAIVHHAMKREPNERFQSAAEMGEALAPWSDGRSAHVLSRLRARGGARGATPSYAPPPGPASIPPVQSVVPPPAIDPRARAEAANARTGQAPISVPPPAAMPAGGTMGSARPVRAARTDMGASREAMDEPPVSSKRTALILAFVGVTLFTMITISTVAWRAQLKARAAASAATADSAPVATTAPSAPQVPPALSLPPEPSSAPPSSATAPATTSAPRPPASIPSPPVPATTTNAPPPRTATPPATGQPGQLNDIKPAQ